MRLTNLVAAVCLVTATAVSVASCGGTSVRRDEGDGAGEGGSAASGGSPARGGSGGTGGTGAAGGTGAVGGDTGGSSGSGGSSTGGTGTCLPTPCPYPACPDGVVVGGGACDCPTCDCSSVVCPTLNCPSERITREFGACCDSCAAAPSCAGVACDPPPSNGCGGLATWQQKPGACCSECAGDEPSGCPDIECGQRNCPRGYVQGHLVGGCCDQCLPDPRFCQADSDCLLARLPPSCCQCTEGISVRMYQENRCWFDDRNPRELPFECNPRNICDRVCEPCPIWDRARCVDNRCVAE